MSAKVKRKAAGNSSRAKKRASDVVVPDKLYFRIGEVADLCDLPAYVLRFWETEFPHLAPKKSSTGQRLYRKKDVENVLLIKKLLYEERFTIEGARQHLKQADAKASAKNQTSLPFIVPDRRRDGLKHVKAGLEEILGILKARR